MVISADFEKQKQYFVKKIIALSQYCLQTSSSDEGLKVALQMLVKLVTYSNATFTLTSKLRKTRDVTSVIYQYILRVAETELKYAKKEKKNTPTHFM